VHKRAVPANQEKKRRARDKKVGATGGRGGIDLSHTKQKNYKRREHAITNSRENTNNGGEEQREMTKLVLC